MIGSSDSLMKIYIPAVVPIRSKIRIPSFSPPKANTNAESGHASAQCIRPWKKSQQCYYRVRSELERGDTS